MIRIKQDMICDKIEHDCEEIGHGNETYLG